MSDRDAANERNVRRWFVQLHSGYFALKISLMDDRNNELRAAVEVDPTQTTRELAARFHATTPTILDHLKHSSELRFIVKL